MTQYYIEINIWFYPQYVNRSRTVLESTQPLSTQQFRTSSTNFGIRFCFQLSVLIYSFSNLGSFVGQDKKGNTITRSRSAPSLPSRVCTPRRVTIHSVFVFRGRKTLVLDSPPVLFSRSSPFHNF